MNRKQFIRNSSMVILGGALPLKTISKKVQDAEESHSSIFDMHCHPGVFFMKGEQEYPGDTAFLKRVEEMQQSQVSGAFFSLVADWPLLQLTDKGVITRGAFKNDEGWQEYKTQLGHLRSLFLQSGLNISKELDEETDRDQLNAFISCEGGDFLGGSLERVSESYKDGVRSIQLVHYAPNDLGDLQTWKEEHGGLSEFGFKVVRKMNDLGMLIDVAHASARTVKNVADTTQDPIILSHSILKDKDQGPIGARAISEGHAQLVAETGGVIGMWPSGISKNLEAFINATIEMIEVVGIDHVGLGTDMDANYKPIIKNYSDIGMWQAGLKEKGLTQSELEKISGGNMRRVIRKVL